MKSIAELIAAGITFEADEAVAIAQQLISTLCAPTNADALHAPYGPPTVANVFLREDGSVFCSGCKATPGVSEVGIFLDSLLPAGSPRVPGGVRYIIARALLEVDVAPFDSLEQLSMSLARHERGDRAAAVRNVLRRAACGRGELSTMPRAERRRPSASTTELRRALREADARLFEQQRLIPRDPVIDLLPATPPAPRDRTMTAAAVCLAAGLVLIGTGEYMHARRPSTPGVANASSVTTQAPPLAVTQATVPDQSRPEPRPGPSVAPGIIVVHDTPSSSRVQTPRMQPRRISLKRTPRAAAAASGADARTVDRAKSRRLNRRPDASQRGVLDRLRLGWLRALAPRSAL